MYCSRCIALDAAFHIHDARRVSEVAMRKLHRRQCPLCVRLPLLCTSVCGRSVTRTQSSAIAPVVHRRVVYRGAAVSRDALFCHPRGFPRWSRPRMPPWVCVRSPNRTVARRPPPGAGRAASKDACRKPTECLHWALGYDDRSQLRRRSANVGMPRHDPAGAAAGNQSRIIRGMK